MDIKKTGEFKGHSGPVYALERGNAPFLFFSGGSDKFIALWNLESRQPEKFSARMPDIVYSICHVREKNLLLAGTAAGNIHVMDLASRKEIKILQVHKGPVFDIRYSAEQARFYSASADGSVGLSSLEDLSALKVKQLCSQKIRNLDVAQGNVAVACGDRSVRVLDCRSLEEGAGFEAHAMSCNAVKFHPDGNRLLTGGKDAYLNVWKMEDGEWKMERSVPAHNYAIYSIVFSPDGKLFATASRDKTVKVWDADTFSVLARINKEKFDGHTHSVNKLLWLDAALLSAGDDRVVMAWKITRSV